MGATHRLDFTRTKTKMLILIPRILIGGNGFKATVLDFGGYSYSISYRELDEKTDSTLMTVW